MKKIIGSYVFSVVTVLCVALLVCGIISVSGETAYIISGEREEVISAEASGTKHLLVRNSSYEGNVFTLSDSMIDVLKLAAELILPSPAANILWAVT